MTKRCWLLEHIDTANSRTLRSCENFNEYLDCAERWLEANGGLVDYYCPSTGEREVYSHADIKALRGVK